MKQFMSVEFSWTEFIELFGIRLQEILNDGLHSMGQGEPLNGRNFRRGREEKGEK